MGAKYRGEMTGNQKTASVHQQGQMLCRSSKFTGEKILCRSKQKILSVIWNQIDMEKAASTLAKQHKTQKSHTYV